jgi:hypothetical protein
MAKKTWQIIAIVLVLALVAVGLGVVKLPFSVAGAGQLTQQPTNVTTAVGTCETSASLALVYNIFDETAGNSTTALNSDYNVIYYFGTSYAGNVAAGSSISVPTNTKVTLYAVDATGAHDVYGFSDSVDMICSGQTLSKTKGMQDSATTVVMYDTSTGIETANAAATPVTLGAGNAAVGQWYVKASTAQARFGTTEGGAKALLVIDYNSLIYKQPTVTSVEGGSASLDVIPNGHNTTAVTGDATSSVAYLISTNNLANLNAIKVNFQAQALTAATNPAATDGNIGVTLYDSELYQNTNGQWVVGFRNADTSADLGEANATDTFHVE